MRSAGVWIFFLVAGSLVAPGPSAVGAQPAADSGAVPAAPPIVITPGRERAFHAALQLFLDEASPKEPGRAARLRERVADGMLYSGVLLPLADEAFLGDIETHELASGSLRYDCGDWMASGADALVEGALRGRESAWVVDFQVWDTARCTRLAAGRVEAPGGDFIRLAKRLADEVVEAFTGTAGVAASEIAFISDRSGVREVWVMDADGGRQRPATRGRGIKVFPDWTPDGKAILYTAYRDRSRPALFLTSRGGHRPGALLDGVLPGLPKYRGAFDPSGEFLALVSSLDGVSEIFRADRTGRELRRLTHSSSIDISPSWSPDGERIAFVSDRSGAPQIYIMDRDGGGIRRLTFNGSYNTTPAWSPDGRWIAYETRVEGQFDLWLIDPSGDVNVPLVTHPRSDESPSWSPDSRKLVFSSLRRGRADIYVIDLDGRHLRRLTARSGSNLQPAWGPFPE